MAECAGSIDTAGLPAFLAAKYGYDVLDAQRAGRVIRVATDDGPKCVKETLMPREVIRMCNQAFAHLRRRGFTEAVAFRDTRSGQPCASFEGRLVVVTDWHDGRRLDFRSDPDLGVAARLLGRLHRASRGFAPSALPADRHIHGQWESRIAGRLAELRSIIDSITAKPLRERCAFDTAVLDLAPVQLKAGDQALALLAASPYCRLAAEAAAERPFCHHDPADHNFIVGPAGERIIDFDYLLCDTPLHDVASLILRALRARRWDSRAAALAAAAYDEENPLPAGWQRVVASFLTWPQGFWRVVRQRYVEMLPWPEERFLARLSQRAQEVAAKVEPLTRLADGELF